MVVQYDELYTVIEYDVYDDWIYFVIVPKHWGNPQR